MAQFNNEVSYPHLVGGYLKRQLRSRHMTQECFAEKIGVDVRTVRRWIKDGVHSLDAVVDLACFFGVGVGDVLSEEEDIPSLLYSYILRQMCLCRLTKIQKDPRRFILCKGLLRRLIFRYKLILCSEGN